MKTMKRVKGRINNRVKICENAYLYLAELEEIVLPFSEVLDYSAALLSDGRLDIEIVAESVEAFEKIKDKIAESVKKNVADKTGHEIDVLVRQSPRNEPKRMTTSMIKRTIIDYSAAEDMKASNIC